MFKAKIYVTYKPSVLDPKAEVIKTALGRMAYHNVEDVLYGKYFELTLASNLIRSATNYWLTSTWKLIALS